MSVYKKVVNTFVFVCKTGEAASLSQGRKLFVSAGQKLMGITLMAYIPDNCIFRTVKNSVQSNGKLYNTKITCKVAAVFSYNIYNSCADFLSQLLKFFLRKFFYIIWRMNLR